MPCQHLAVYTLNIEYEYIKMALRRNLRIFLSERACRRIARIFERLLLVIFLLLNKLHKDLTRHINLASDLYLVKLSFKAQRYRADRAEICADVLADNTIATG